MPSLGCTHILENLKKGPHSICAPTSVGNIILYEANKNNRSNLLTGFTYNDLQSLCCQMVGILRQLMNTDRNGTTIEHVIEGLKKYIKDRRYKIKFEWIGLFYKGSYKVKDEVHLPSILERAMGTKNAILWTGEYRFNKRDKIYNRVDGHAATIAGFNLKYNSLLMHDPAISFQKPTFYIISQQKKTLPTITGLPGEKQFIIGENNLDKDISTRLVEGALSFEISR